MKSNTHMKKNQKFRTLHLRSVSGAEEGRWEEVQVQGPGEQECEQYVAAQSPLLSATWRAAEFQKQDQGDQQHLHMTLVL